MTKDRSTEPHDVAKSMNKTMEFWILGEDGTTPERVDFEGYMAWCMERNAISSSIKQTDVGDKHVSTVFIAQMVSRQEIRELELMTRCFETLVSSSSGADVEARYPTYEEAEKGHDAIVDRLSASLPKPQ